MGVYLGMSMQHARSVALILNLKTGHVSPQFHVTFDPKFETVRQSMGNLSPPSEWQKICGFTTSSASNLQGLNQSTQDQLVHQGVPFMEFDLEPGAEVNEGEGQAFPTPLPQPEGDQQDQEPQAQQPRRSPRLNKVTEDEAEVKDSQASTRGSKVLEVWYHLDAKLETKLPYHVAFEAIAQGVGGH
jgi:hypothetical protein